MYRDPTNARDVAWAVLDEYKRSGAFVAALLARHVAGTDVSDRERRLAREIVSGVVRRQATLNALIGPQVSRPRHRIEGALWTLLQIGVYQLVFLDSVPPHAAVHEMVETAKRAGQRQWTGFLNGVLRSVSRQLTHRFIDRPGPNTIPVDENRYRLCASAVFPDPESDPCGYVATAFSFPSWLIRGWARRFEFPELCWLGFWFNAPAKITLRANRLKTTRDELFQELYGAGVTASAGHRPEAILLEGTVRIEELPGFREGEFTVQDETAMHAAALLAPQPGENVLDLCAGPGTKTTHLAELMDNRGRIVAADVQSDRLEQVTQNSRRLGMKIIETQLVNPDGSDVPKGPFDAILVDVPCSNTGVLGKRPEARWRLQPRDLTELAALQKRLLSSASSRSKPGGRIVYSTCSIEPEENQRVVQAVLGEHPELRLSDEVEHVPGRPADGGYAALLHRHLVAPNPGGQAF